MWKGFLIELWCFGSVFWRQFSGGIFISLRDYDHTSNSADCPFQVNCNNKYFLEKKSSFHWNFKLCLHGTLQSFSSSSVVFFIVAVVCGGWFLFSVVKRFDLRDSTLARHVLYNLRASDPFCYDYLGDRVCFFPRWAWTTILPFYTSHHS
jgi:hypothetical protein